MHVGMLADPSTQGSHVPSSEKIAHFSMEIGLAESMPTYSGGLGLLAGDTVRRPKSRSLGNQLKR